MEKNIDLSKNIYSKSQYEKVINTEFNEFGVKSISQQIDDEITVEEFFELYNSLFYDIPIEGSTNSHKFLVQKSSDYSNFSADQEELDALRNEISNLRKELLAEQIKNVKLELGDSESNNELDDLTKKLTQSDI